MLDRVGAKRPVMLGCTLAAVGFWLWGQKVTDLSLGAQIWFIVLAGAGMGFMLGPASTDAVNRASRLSYGEATGITQTVRNYAASLGIAVLGTLLVSQLKSHVTSSLVAQGLSHAAASAQAQSISEAHERHRRDSALRAARLRLRDALGPLCAGGGDGLGGGRRRRRAPPRCAGGDGGSRDLARVCGRLGMNGRPA